MNKVYIKFKKQFYKENLEGFNIIYNKETNIVAIDKVKEIQYRVITEKEHYIDILYKPIAKKKKIETFSYYIEGIEELTIN